MKKFGLYVLGFKGYRCLQVLIAKFGADCIGFVVGARDRNITEDHFESIKKLCSDNCIVFKEKSKPRGINTDVEFAIGWRWLISDLNNLIVFHDSLLPKFRGFSPLVNALIEGTDEIGVTALKATEHYDAGDILAQKKTIIGYPKKIIDAIEDVSELYAELLLEICEKVIRGQELDFYKQVESKASYSLWRDEVDYKINWSREASYIARFINAVGEPYKGAQTTINGNTVRIYESLVVDDVKIEDRLEHIGKVIFMNSGLPTVVCGEGLLQLTCIVNNQGESLLGEIPFRTRFGL